MTSSSSSGSGSLSSQSVPSSIDSGGTLSASQSDLVEGDISDENQLLWGRLIPVGDGFHRVDLIKDQYIFGRDKDNMDVIFEQSSFNAKYFAMLSKKHFQINKETSDSGEHVAIIEDFSSNGTYINGVLVGQGNKQVIVDNGKICLPTQDHTAYIFQDLKTIFTEEATFPREIREKYTIFKFLGSGVCGYVHHAFTKGRECKGVAIKVITKAKFASQSYSNRTSIFQEVAVLKKLNHPSIVKYIDAVNTTDKLFIVLELVEGGELYDRIVKQKRLDERVTKLYFYQMLVAVKYLHEEGFTHRDLKPENVLLSSFDEETLVKITDFGLSKFVGEQSLMQTLCGTPSYLAPEVLSSNGVLSYKKDCDCWSLGVILYVCLSGGAPFSNTPENPLTKQIISGEYSFSNHCWRNVSGEAKDLIKKLMTVDPNQRITVAHALEHPWMKDEEIIEKANMLMEGPSIAGEMSQPSTTVIKRKQNDTVIDNSVTKKQKPSDDYEDKTFVL